MKKHALNFAIVGLLTLMASCSNTKQIVLHTTEPSPVLLSDQIKRIGIVNKSEASNEMEGHTAGMNGLVVAQEQWITERGKDAAIAGLFDELLKDERFDTVKLLDSIASGMRAFSQENNGIAWDEITAICNSYEVDALFAMAFYETDTKVSVKKSSMLQPNLMRVKVKVPAQELTMETLIENGWRIYYPKNRQIIDEIVFNDQFVSTGKGTNALAAYQAIGDRKETLIQQSRTTGSNYGLRLLPFENSVAREYYVKGSDNLVLAGDLVEQGDWEGAARLWEMDVEHKEVKIRRRNCHNLAVMNERKEDLETALQWASKAYDTDQHKDALDYMNILEKRLESKAQLNDQLAHLEFPN